MANSYTSKEFLFGFEGRINRAKFWFAAFIWFAAVFRS